MFELFSFAVSLSLVFGVIVTIFCSLGFSYYLLSFRAFLAVILGLVLGFFVTMKAIAGISRFDLGFYSTVFDVQFPPFLVALGAAFGGLAITSLSNNQVLLGSLLALWNAGLVYGGFVLATGYQNVSHVVGMLLGSFIGFMVYFIAYGRFPVDIDFHGFQRLKKHLNSLFSHADLSFLDELVLESKEHLLTRLFPDRKQRRQEQERNKHEENQARILASLLNKVDE